VRDIVGRHLDMYLPADEPRAPAAAPRSHSRRNSNATDISEGRASTSSLPPALLRTPTRR
jgi:hypothetical protein